MRTAPRRFPTEGGDEVLVVVVGGRVAAAHHGDYAGCEFEDSEVLDVDHCAVAGLHGEARIDAPEAVGPSYHPVGAGSCDGAVEAVAADVAAYDVGDAPVAERPGP